MDDFNYKIFLRKHTPLITREQIISELLFLESYGVDIIKPMTAVDEDHLHEALLYLNKFKYNELQRIKKKEEIDFQITKLEIIYMGLLAFNELIKVTGKSKIH